MVAVAAIIPSLFVVPLISSNDGVTKTRRRGKISSTIRPQSSSSSSYRSLQRTTTSNTQTTTLSQSDCDIVVKENHEELLDDHPFLIDEEYELKDEEKDQLRFLIQQRKTVESLLASVIDNDQGRPSPYDPLYPMSTIVTTGTGGERERHRHAHSTTGGDDLDLTRSFQEALDRYQDDNDGGPSSSPSHPSTSTTNTPAPTILIPQSAYDSWNDHDQYSIMISQKNAVVVQPIPVLSSPSSVTTTVDTRLQEALDQYKDDNDRTTFINNGRKSKIQRFAKAGVKDHFRIIHSLVGLSSILLGFHHMMEVLIVSSFTLAEISIGTIIGTGLVHTCTGLFGIRRLHFHNPKEAARNAMFWPAPIQALWLASVSLTEWGQGSNAILSMWDTPFVAFTAFNIALTLWQLSQILTKTGSVKRTKDTIWFQKSSHNAILVEFSYLFWMQIQMGTVLYLAINPHTPAHDFTAFMDTYPKMQLLLSNLALNTAFFNNLAIFLATLLRYKILRKPTTSLSSASTNTTTGSITMTSLLQDNKVVFSLPLFSSIFIVWKVFSCFFFSYDGSMSSSFISLIFQ